MRVTATKSVHWVVTGYGRISMVRFGVDTRLPYTLRSSPRAEGTMSGVGL